MKKRILFLSNFSLANTGFGKYQKNLLTHLYKTGKYELGEIACGISSQEPTIHKLPWKVYGVLPNNQEESMRFNAADDTTKHAYQYGLFRFDEAVFDFKPDIVFHHEDVWGTSGWLKSMKSYGKFVSVQFHPFDAEPMTDVFVDFLKDFKHIYTYGKWSQGIGFKAGLHQTKIAALGVDHNIFKPLDSLYVKELRTKWGVADNEFVVIMVARNQVRKKFDALFESLNDIAKMNPELYKNIKILPFTFYQDAPGINFTRFWKSRNIDESKILTPYICDDMRGESRGQGCRGYHIAKKYEGETKDCPLCGAKGSCHTPSVVSGMTDEQLNELYNISDLKALPTSNEGFGLSLTEALAAGKIILSTGYSTSAELCEDSGAGFTIPCVKYVEHQTMFYKAHVTPYEIAKQINKIYNIKPETRKQMGMRGREFAMKYHSYEYLGKQWEIELDAIESLKDVNWSTETPKKNSNPRGIVPHFSTMGEIEWLVAMYKHILDTDIMAETKGNPLLSNGVQYWLMELKEKKRSKEQIEQFFRETAAREQSQKPVDIRDLLDPLDQKRLLFLCKESAGDNFICTAIVASLKEKYSDHSIYIASKTEFASIWKNNPSVKRWLPFNDIMTQYGWGIDRFEKGIFNIVLTPTALTQFAPATWHNNGNTQSFIV